MSNGQGTHFLGSFLTGTLGASFVAVERCGFTNALVGVLHADGLTHKVLHCNYENRIP